MKVLKDSLVYIIGEIIAKALPFLLLPYLTRRLGVAGFGELSLYQTYLAILIIFFSLCQDGAVTRYFYVYGKRNLPYLVLTGYIYTLMVVCFGLMIAWWYQSLVWAAVILASMAQSVLSTQLAIRQCQKMAIAYTAIQIGSGLLSTLLTVMLLEVTQEHAVAWRFVAIFVANVSVSALAAMMFWRQQTHRVKKTPSLGLMLLNFSYILSIGIPTLLHQLSGVAKGQLDRILVYQKFSAEDLGIYASGYQVAMVFSVLLLAVNKAIVPYYYQAIKSGKISKDKVLKWSVLSCAVTPVPALVASVIPQTLFLWVLGSDYIGVKYYICLFLLAFGLTIPYLILVNFLFYHAKNKQISTISVLSTLFYIGCLWYLSQWGQTYLPFALIISNLVMIVLLFFMVKKEPVS